MEMSTPTAQPVPTVLVLYGRDGCHLCDEARSILDALMAARGNEGLPTADIVEVDITTDEALHLAFLTTIPVVDCNGHRLELATTAGELRRFLADALDGRGAPAATSVTHPVPDA